MKVLFPDFFRSSYDNLVFPLHCVDDYAKRHFPAYGDMLVAEHKAWDAITAKPVGKDVYTLISDLNIYYLDYLQGVDRFFYYKGISLGIHEFCDGEFIDAAKLKRELFVGFSEFIGASYANRQIKRATYGIKVNSFLIKNPQALRVYLALCARRHLLLRNLFVVAGYEYQVSQFKGFCDTFECNDLFMHDLHDQLNELAFADEGSSCDEISLVDQVLDPAEYYARIDNMRKCQADYIADLIRIGASHEDIAAAKHQKLQIMNIVKKL